MAVLNMLAHSSHVPRQTAAADTEPADDAEASPACRSDHGADAQAFREQEHQHAVSCCLTGIRIEHQSTLEARLTSAASYYALSIILGTVALSYGSVPLYKTICQQTGWGGQPIKSAAHTSSDPDADIASKLTPITSSRRLRITFAGSTSDILPWKFTPQQREVRVLPGETALAFYTATNQSKDEDIIGVATYSVTPAQVAPYFSKIQCFCFEEQRLNKGETVDMPVFFYIDPEFLRDPNMKGIDTITLNYTFFSEFLLLCS